MNTKVPALSFKFHKLPKEPPHLMNVKFERPLTCFSCKEFVLQYNKNMLLEN